MDTDRRSFLSGATVAGGALVAPLGPATTAPMRSVLDDVPPAMRDAILAGTSEDDCGPAIRAAIARGGTVHLPAGRYVVRTPIASVPQVAGRFAPGVRLVGDGAGRTIVEDRTTGAALFDFDSGASLATGFRAITGVHLGGFTIDGARAGKAAAAIRLRCCFQSLIADLHITDRPGSGIAIVCRYGDTDASNMIDLERVRIENCAGWGIDAAAVPGCNEISYLSLRHVIVQNCGTRSRAPIPASGGMRYKGQMLTLAQCAFTLNQNVGLFIPGEPGLAINVELASTTFENNVDRHFLCTGVSVLRATNLQFFSVDRYRVTTACEFAGATHTVRAIAIDGVTVRATAANAAYTAFRFGGANLIAATCEVRNVVFEDFGYPGQTRFDGDPSIMARR